MNHSKGVFIRNYTVICYTKQIMAAEKFSLDSKYFYQRETDAGLTTEREVTDTGSRFMSGHSVIKHLSSKGSSWRTES